MAEKRKKLMISTLRSDWEAAGLFLSGKGLLSEKADVFFLHKNESQGLGILTART